MGAGLLQNGWLPMKKFFMIIENDFIGKFENNLTKKR